MGAPDSTAQAALDQEVSYPGYCAFLDILDDPLRVNSTRNSLTFSGSGDADLDGQLFTADQTAWMSVSAVTHKEGGGSSVTVTLSGLIGVDTDTLDEIGDRTRWQGRFCRLWAFMIGADGLPTGNIWPYYTGYMTAPKISGDASGQTIVMTVESWLAFMTQASGRSWLAQSEFDAGDMSAELSIAIANGTANVTGAIGKTKAPITQQGYGGTTR